MKVIEYMVVVPSIMSFEEIRDMLRYSCDRPIIKNWNYGEEKVLIMRRYLPRGRITLRRDFLRNTVIPRWNSFGCKTQILDDNAEANQKDRNYFDVGGWNQFESPISLEEFMTNNDTEVK